MKSYEVRDYQHLIFSLISAVKVQNDDVVIQNIGKMPLTEEEFKHRGLLASRCHPTKAIRLPLSLCGVLSAARVPGAV